MPAQTLPAPAVQPHSTRPSRGFVLVVDDEEPNRTLLRDPLEAQGYEVAEADHGLEMLRQIDRRLPDVILLDVMMPGMDGFQLCKRVKQNPLTAHVPVLMVTSLAERKERLLGIQAGANDFLTKPVDLQDLLLRVANAAAAKSLYDQLQAERDRSERLLLNTLPRAIADRMKKGEVNIADHHPDVTILHADLVGFTALTVHIAPEQLVSLLNEMFSSFDLLADELRLEKIKTIGDAYMVAGGIPAPRPDHPEAIAELALRMRAAIEDFNRQYRTSIQIRIGISTGPVIAGVIGRRKFAYDLWGDAVNIACRLESCAQSGAIQVSVNTFERIKSRYQFEGGELIDLKGRGPVAAYRLIGRLQG